MRLFNFFKRKQPTISPQPITGLLDKSKSTGKDFEFLLSGDFDIPADKYDEIMTPSSFYWTKIQKDNWNYYQVGQDEFSYSLEMPGIQMMFNTDITYQKARQIADEVVVNLNAAGYETELITLDKTKVYRFD